ncbi:MAG: hypothetical protein RIS24_3178 [Verrucomicrobiota bacterium]|jgi:hypothetical protein
MNIGSQFQYQKNPPLSITKARWSFVWLAPWLGIFAALVAHAQPINIDLSASGAGTVETPCPRPYQIGQGYVARAIPGASARFLRWDDGSTNPERYRVLDSRLTNWVAYFEAIVLRPFLEEFGLEALDPKYMARVGLVIEGGRSRLEFPLPGKVAFRVLASTNLATMPFKPVPFALSVSGNLDRDQAMGVASSQVVWAESAEGTDTFYQIEWIGGGNLPAVYLAQATEVKPGADFFVYGTGFQSGIVAVVSNHGDLATQVINDQTLLVKAPSSASDLTFRVKVGGSFIPGEIALKVSAPSSDLALGPIPKETVVEGGLIRLTGSGFTAAQTKVFIGSTPLQIIAVAASGTELGAQIPVGTTSGVLSITQAGRLVTGQLLQVKPSLIGYMPFVPQGLHISTWETAKPRRFGYVPFVAQGLHVSTWETAKPRRFGYVPFVPNGLFVESK